VKLCAILNDYKLGAKLGHLRGGLAKLAEIFVTSNADLQPGPNSKDGQCCMSEVAICWI